MAYTRYYELSTSGLNFDRFVERFDEPTLNKMRQQYWTAKQLIRKKLGKKEDEYLLASDAEFDAKVDLFRFVQETSDQMLCCIDDYQHYLSEVERQAGNITLELAQMEFELSKMLKEDGDVEGTAAGRIMIAVGKVLALSVRHRLELRNPLLRLFGELQVFTERAIVDCAETAEAAEKARTEYRGSLLWMKKTSKELDPDAENILEKFRTAQNVVRRNKEKLDNLKLDTLQKVDLLIASRYNLFSQLLISYQKLLLSFYEQTMSAYEKIYDFVSTPKQYKFEVLTDLVESLEEPTCRNDDQIATVEKEPENLIEINQCEQEMEQILEDLENLNKRDLLDDRIESPLGLPGGCGNDDSTVGSTSDMPQQTLISIDENIESEISSSAVIPAIAPPPGWNLARNASRCTTDLIDLQFLNDATSEGNSFTSDWSKLTGSITTTVPLTASSPAPSTSSLTLPSQLLELPSTGSNFPNPFADSTDPNFNIWKGLLMGVETGKVNGSGAFKNC